MILEQVGETLFRLLHRPGLLAWYAFRLRHRDYGASPIPVISEQGQDLGDIHERNLQAIVTEPPGQSFLEIGIGWTPRIVRVKTMQASGVHYTACDFAVVCDRHRAAFQNAGIDMSTIRFLPNHVGTYAWTLMELVRKRERFDVIYLDGHHTFYVDLPAVFLADMLLKPGGYLLLDDVLWTLNFMKRQLYNLSDEWSVYRGMYDFASYEAEQQAVPHVKMMAEAILIEKRGFQKVDRYSTEFWWALRKPETNGASP
jgi:hypothetical protein